MIHNEVQQARKLETKRSNCGGTYVTSSIQGFERNQG